jgi:hypothetical protein
MIITRTSTITGVTHSIDLPVTEEQMIEYNRGALLQNAFPNLSAGDREFIKSGVTDSEWKDIFGTDEEEDAE